MAGRLFKGNIIRGILSTTIITACVLLIATSLAGIHTQLALAGDSNYQQE